MSVDRASARHMARHEGQRFYFCSAGCQAKFEAEPAKYLEGRPAPASPKASGPAGTQYTCPMHPEIVQDGPGDCTLCGMALAPRGVPTGEEAPNPALSDYTRRSRVGPLLT